MKRVMTILTGVVLALPLSAQTQDCPLSAQTQESPLSAQTEGDGVLAPDSVMTDRMMDSFVDEAGTGVTLWRPSFYGMPPYGTFSVPVWRPGVYGPGFMNVWDVHEGFNASVDMGVSVGFGKRNPWRGAHFFTNVTGLYAHPVNDRLTLAAGMDYSYFSGWGRGLNSIGLFGLANYRINEKLDVTGFVSHDFGQLSPVRPLESPMMPFAGPSTTVGADLGIKLGENTKINLGISFTREQYNMGMPDYRNPSRDPFHDEQWPQSMR